MINYKKGSAVHHQVTEILKAVKGLAGKLDLLHQQAEAENVSKNVVDTVITRFGVSVEPGDASGGEVPQLPCKSPAMDAALLTQINSWLKLLDKPSFYSLLDLPARTTPAKIVAAAQIMYDRWSKVLPKTSECVAWEKSLQACITYLKNAETKARYDRALYNQRIDQFVKRIDLVMAGGRMTKDGQVFLSQMGAREFGFSSPIVNKCIQARAIANGVSLKKPVAVTVQMHGQVQCMRCFSWNPQGHHRCWNCSSSLGCICENPTCRAKLVSNSKICERCQLPVAKGRRYAELLKLVDSSLNQGDGDAAMKWSML